jgi:hypothetical protein
MGLSGAVVAASAVGNPDGGHQGDPHVLRVERPKDVAHAAVIDGFRARFAQAVRAEREYDGVHTVDGVAKRSGVRFPCFTHVVATA